MMKELKLSYLIDFYKHLKGAIVVYHLDSTVHLYKGCRPHIHDTPMLAKALLEHDVLVHELI